jgi:tetratricopeptide (TPR) repeat protein
VRLVVGLILALASDAVAFDKGSLKSKQKKGMSSFAEEHLQAAQDLIGEKKHAEAIAKLDEMKGKKLEPIEKAYMYQAYGSAYAALGKLPEAAGALEACLAEKAFPEETDRSIRWVLGQIQLSNGKADRALELLTAWLAKEPNPTPAQRYTVALAFAKAGRSLPALRHVEASIAAEDPKDAWLQLELNLLIEMKAYAEAVLVLARMTARDPAKRTLWAQITGLGAVEKEAVFELQDGQPEKAAAVLEEAMGKKTMAVTVESLALHGAALLAAKKIAESKKVLEEAAKLATTGEIDLQLAQISIDRGDRTEAEAQIARGIAKGKLRDDARGSALAARAKR